jgi:plasmid stabilization system protein ParE
MTFDFHPEAMAEYEEAGIWYEERRHRLGLEFLAAVETAVATILKSPDRYQPVGSDVRVFRLKRFPYSLFFRFSAAERHIRIVSVMHHKRRPDVWRGRL